MYEEFLKRMANSKISKDNILRISTILNWITNTSQLFKKTMTL